MGNVGSYLFPFGNPLNESHSMPAGITSIMVRIEIHKFLRETRIYFNTRNIDFPSHLQSGNQFLLGCNLGVHLQPDHHLPVARFAFVQIGHGVGCRIIRPW